jgi:hypothetical protein
MTSVPPAPSGNRRILPRFAIALTAAVAMVAAHGVGPAAAASDSAHVSATLGTQSGAQTTELSLALPTASGGSATFTGTVGASMTLSTDPVTGTRTYHSQVTGQLASGSLTATVVVTTDIVHPRNSSIATTTTTVAATHAGTTMNLAATDSAPVAAGSGGNLTHVVTHEWGSM